MLILPGSVDFPPMDRDQVNVTGCATDTVRLMMISEKMNRMDLILCFYRIELVFKVSE